jgi:hypothetical protein
MDLMRLAPQIIDVDLVHHLGRMSEREMKTVAASQIFKGGRKTAPMLVATKTPDWLRWASYLQDPKE